MITSRQLSITAGISYLIIFFTAIYANFFVLDALITNPLETVIENSIHIRFGVMAFLFAAVFDVVVAWSLYELYKGNILSSLSTYFRIIHAALMGGALFALLNIIYLNNPEEILNQVATFNNIWLIGLFFFGCHLILLHSILKDQIKIIPKLLLLAGMMYIIDTGAHFLLPNYASYAQLMLTLVAIPAILGEMSFSIWLLLKGGK